MREVACVVPVSKPGTPVGRGPFTAVDDERGLGELCRRAGVVGVQMRHDDDPHVGWLDAASPELAGQIAIRAAAELVQPELVELSDELGLVSPDSAVVVFERLDHAELLGVLGELRAVHREVLGLLLVEQLSYKEIAVVLGVPLGTVKSRVSNARRALAGLLARGSSAS